MVFVRKSAGGDKIGVKYGNEFAGGAFQPFLEGARFETLAIGPVMVFDVVPDISISFTEGLGESMGIVGGIVEDLNLQQIARVFNFHHFVDEALQNIALVIEGKLNGDGRQLLKAQPRFGNRLFSMFEIGSNHLEPVHPIDRKDAEKSKIRNENRPVEPTQVVNTGEGIVEQAAGQLVQRGCSQQCR